MAFTSGDMLQDRLQETIIGVLADTHIPDRVTSLHPEILPTFDSAGVSYILHAGDISTARVLSDLAQVAPVTAVRGNRDFLTRRLPMVEQLNLGGVRVALMHGHGGLLFYLKDKLQFILEGYRLERYLDMLADAAEDARVAIFGHTHYPVITTYRGKLIINPGSATFSPSRSEFPSVVLLRISSAGDVRPELIYLRGWEIRSRVWVRL